MWDEYKIEQQNLRAPEFLKARTLEKMNAQKKKKIIPFIPILVATFSFLIIFFTGQRWWFHPGLPTNLAFERVESGNLHFSAIQDSAREDLSLEEFEGALGVEISRLPFPNLILEDSAWSLDEDVLQLRASYTFVGEENSIELMLSNATDRLETNSVLEGRELALYYQVMLLETTYIAIFIENDIQYQVRMRGTEEEFMTHLKKILNFLNIG